MYSADNPSPRYRQILDYYRLMHRNGFSRRVGSEVVHVSPEDAFSGRDLTRYAYSIRGLVRATKSVSLLDYGSGKGKQYSEEFRRGDKLIAASLHDFWKMREITCYDPAINRTFLSEKHQFDGVIASNVIDYIPEEDLGWVIEVLFSRARKFVFCNVADFPAPFSLPNGENARITRKPRQWWGRLFKEINARHPDIAHCLAFVETRHTEDGERKQATSYIHNCPGLILPGPRIRVSGNLKVSR